ncbi:MAG TPA: isoprenylcysteine carboxylmethyltransferase family protein [Gemmatimonadaceae bacterium]|nr:isoprenylcysteine carboxylmethyltransferase family protein [Gemmatimonadaceae bacterium]
MSSIPSIQRLRVPLGFVLGGLYLWFARPTTGSLLLGAVVALAGLAMRGWAAGHIVKNDRLATTGPYAHTRNPLYLGSFLIAAGFALAAHWSMLLLVIAFFALVYAPTIAREREFVRGRFPAAYAEYERNVPPFLPRPTPWSGGDRTDTQPWSLALYLRHKEWQAALVYVLAIAWLVYRLRPTP